MANLTVIIPTIGRHTLRRTLDSIAAQQPHPDDQILVIGDTLSRPQDEAAALVAEYGPPFEYHPFAGSQHYYGTPQRMYALHNLATEGNWLSWIDDTDMYTAGAWDIIKRNIDEADDGLPHIYRFVAQWGIVPGHIAPGQVGGHSIVAPIIPDKLGSWPLIYQGDYTFIVETIGLHGGQCRRYDDIIADARGGYNGQVVG